MQIAFRRTIQLDLQWLVFLLDVQRYNPESSKVAVLKQSAAVATVSQQQLSRFRYLLTVVDVVSFKFVCVGQESRVFFAICLYIQKHNTYQDFSFR